MRWINVDAKVDVQLFDCEHEDYITKKMTVEEMLDAFTEDGCPTILPSERIGSQPEHKIQFTDKDHVWINSKQFISLRRFHEAVNEARADVPSAQPERLTDDDFETIRIHLNAFKEKLCNQQRWKEAEEYQRIIDRFMAFASARPEKTCEYWDSESGFCALYKLSAQSERPTGRWVIRNNPGTGWYKITCSECWEDVTAIAPCIGFFPNTKVNWDYCPNCGAEMQKDGE